MRTSRQKINTGISFPSKSMPGVVLAGVSAGLVVFLLCISTVAYPAVIGDAYWPNAAASPSSTPIKDLPTLESIQASHINSKKGPGDSAVPFIRAEGIQSAAAAYGTQAGLSFALAQINDALAKSSKSYDKIYNFEAVLLEPGVLPPVISEGREAYNQTSDNVVRAADLVYKIEFDARLINTPPRWQNYLAFKVDPPELPDASLLPKTPAENKIWDDWVSRGWKEGEEQGRTIFISNLARLNRDYIGMWRFKRLYSQGMVSMPIIARSSLGVTGGGKEMSVNDRVVEITDSSKLNPNEQHWLYPSPK